MNDHPYRASSAIRPALRWYDWVTARERLFIEIVGAIVFTALGLAVALLVA